jgi:dihydrofolate reductase
VLDASGATLMATQDAVILGRRRYDEWVEFWPGSEIEPFATFINVVEKYVATSTPLDREWANTTVIDGDLVEFVRDLIRLESIRSVTSPSGHLLVDYRPIE